jgi:ABC-2 type transport system ATP-binding protein
MTKPVLEVTNLRSPHAAGPPLSLTVHRGEIVALCGPTATTILEAIAASPPPPAGTAAPARLATVWRDGGLFPGLTVAEVVDTWRRWTLDPLTRQEALWLTGLSGEARTRFEHLSPAARRRLDLALALVGRSDLLLLEEPTAALPPAARDEIWTLLRTLATRGVTIILATRDPAEAHRADHRHPLTRPTPAQAA